jgi:ATP adenylyltransferase
MIFFWQCARFFEKDLEMKRLYAPWRSSYVTKSEHKKTSDECIFCTCGASLKNDDVSFIIARYDSCFVMMNAYPYNAGHLMVIPYCHIGELFALDMHTRSEMMNVVADATNVLKNTLNPDGFNIGINMGAAAGAGIPDHIHIHVLPRWHGDTNFMPLLADTKHISMDLTVMYKKIKNAWR